MPRLRRPPHKPQILARTGFPVGMTGTGSLVALFKDWIGWLFHLLAAPSRQRPAPPITAIIKCTLYNRQGCGRYLRVLTADDLDALAAEAAAHVEPHDASKDALIDAIEIAVEFIEHLHGLTPRSHLFECAA